MFMRPVNQKPRWVTDTVKSTNNREIDDSMLWLMQALAEQGRLIMLSIDDEQSPRFITFKRRPALVKLRVKQRP